MTHQNKGTINILFVCLGSILKSSGKASKINGLTVDKGVYYTIFKRTLM